MDEYQKRSQQEVARLQVGLKSLLIIPLVWQTGVHGVLTFRAFEPAAFGEHEIEFAWQVANQIVGAISASNQYSKLESESRERERLAEEQLRTAEIGRMVSSTLDLDDVFSAFVEQAAHLVPLDRVVISLVNSDGETIKDAFISGQSIDDGKSGSIHPIENNVKESVIANNEVLVANGAPYEFVVKTHTSEMVRFDSGLKSLLVVPLAWKGTVVGTLSFRSLMPSPYGDHEVDLPRQIGAQIAGAVATADQYRQLQEAVSDIRKQAAALDASADAVVILKPDSSIEYGNDAFVRDTGYSRDEPIGRKSPFLRSDKDSPTVYEEMWETARSGNPGPALSPRKRKTAPNA